MKMTDKPDRVSTPQRPEASGPPRRPSDATPPPQMPRRSWLGFVLILLVNYLALRFLFPSAESVKVPYSTFKQQASQGNVTKIFSRGDRVSGQFARPIQYPAKPDSSTKEQPRKISQFTTTIPAFADPGLESLLVAHGTEISAEPAQGSTWVSLLLGFAPSLLIIALYVWLFR